MVSNLLIICRAACAGSATSATESSAISTVGGATSYKLTTRGYSLTQSKMWKSSNNPDDNVFYGVELTYSSDCCGGADIKHMYGSQTGFVFSVNIA